MKKFVLLFFICGVIFRIWISSVIAQPYGFDQVEYSYFAQQIMTKGLFVWSARLYGYPLILSAIYKIFGIDNFLAVKIFQSILDSGTGILVYLLANKIFKNRKLAFLCLGLYIFNPYTSSLVGLVLSDIVATFLFTLILYLLTLLFEKKKKLTLLVLGLLLGFLPQVRSTFLFFDTVLLVFLLIKTLKGGLGKKTVIASVLTAALFFLPFTYNLVGNWVYFKQISLTTVDNLFVREFYVSLFTSGDSKAHENNSYSFPPELQNIYSEYSSKPKNEIERSQMAQKYLNLSFLIIKSNPVNFIRSWFIKMGHVWEKPTLFIYTQSKYSLVDHMTYWGNILILLLSACGLYKWIKSKAISNIHGSKIFVVAIIIYMSVLHSFTGADGRYTIPVYPLIFLFMGYGIYTLTHDSNF